MNWAHILFAIQVYSGICDAANILYAIPFTSKSHEILLRPLGVELARRGHNVTVITAYEVSDPSPNFHQIITPKVELWEAIDGERPNVFTTIDMSTTKFIDIVLWEAGYAFTELLLNSTPMQEFLKRDYQFDLVISETFIQEAMYTLAHKFNTPLVLITAFGNCMRHNLAVGNPLQLATTIFEFVPIENPTSFMGRLKNLYLTAYDYINWRYWYLPKQEALVQKYIPNLPQPVPSLYEMQQNASLFLINSHFSYDVPMALLPNIVEIGGIHADWYNETIPKDVERILNESQHGVVYVNFGSNIRSSELPVEKKLAFLNAFKKLKETVLWKWEDDTLKETPPNVITKKWFPQRKILAHPNIKLFMGHGGLMSTQEAVYYGVPTIGMPIYTDQYNNLLLLEEAGAGLILQYRDIEETVDWKIKKILNDDTFSKNAKEMSRRFRDRPMSAMDTAVYWVEYVIRNNGANHIKSPSLNLHWIQYNMFDVYAFLLFVLAAIIFVTFKLIIMIYRLTIIPKTVNRKKKQKLR